MREYKFRGKRIDTNEWIYGFYVEGESGPSILYRNKGDGSLERKRVHPETVGQSTELKDRNEVEIYEGDVLKYAYNIMAFADEVVYEYGMYCVKNKFYGLTIYLDEPYKYEVVRNIHDKLRGESWT